MFGKNVGILPNLGKFLCGPLGVLFLYGAFFAFAYAASDFHHAETVRYLLPLFPLLAAAVSAALPFLPRPARAAGVLLVASAVALFASDLPRHAEKVARNRGWFDRSRETADALRERGAKSAFANYVMLAVGLENPQVLIDCPLPERFPEVAREIELSPSQPAVLEDFNGFKHFLAATGATADYGQHGWRMHTRIARRAAREEALPRAATGEAHVARDGGMTTWTWSLAEARDVSGVRVWPLARDPHPAWQLETRAEGGDWEPLAGPWKDTGFSFSGERLYFGGACHRFELLAPAARRAKEVRLSVDDGATAVRRVQLLTPAAERTASRPNHGALARRLKRLGRTCVYADRETANALEARTSREPSLFPDSLLAEPVRWGGETALVSRLEDAPGLRDDLRAAGVPFSETRAAGHVVFLPEGAPETPLRFLGVALAP